MIYLYDGTFEGLLSSLRTVILNRLTPIDIISEADYRPSLYDKTKIISTLHERDITEFLIYISKKLSEAVINRLLISFLSELKGFEMLLLNYILLGLGKGRGALNNIADPSVHRVNEMTQKVWRECHRFYGLLRFAKAEGDIYYAPMEPDHNIISIIAPHFSSRLRDQDWIIHDRRRDTAVLYNAKTRQMEQVCIDIDKIVPTEEEGLIQAMWQAYFKCISISSRNNPVLQKRFMPRRYWRYLTEKA